VEEFVPWEQPLLAELDHPIQICSSVDTIPIDFLQRSFLLCALTNNLFISNFNPLTVLSYVVHRSSNASLSSSSDAMTLSFSAALLNLVGDLINGDDASPPNESRLHAEVNEAAHADDASADDDLPPLPDDVPAPPPPADDDTLPPCTADDGPAVPPLESRIPTPENRLCCSLLRACDVLPLVTFMVRCQYSVDEYGVDEYCVDEYCDDEYCISE